MGWEEVLNTEIDFPVKSWLGSREASLDSSPRGEGEDEKHLHFLESVRNQGPHGHSFSGVALQLPWIWGMLFPDSTALPRKRLNFLRPWRQNLGSEYHAEKESGSLQCLQGPFWEELNVLHLAGSHRRGLWADGGRWDWAQNRAENRTGSGLSVKVTRTLYSNSASWRAFQLGKPSFTHSHLLSSAQMLASVTLPFSSYLKNMHKWTCFLHDKMCVYYY